MFALWLVPFFLAKGQRNCGAITTLNLLAGWVAAIVWAVKLRGEAKPPALPKKVKRSGDK
jgi:hypothetical protein